jgi:hypothetical protein
VRRAFELRGAGKSYQQIADEMGVSLMTANRWVREALATLPTDSAEELRRLALVRCQRAMDALMARLRSGDVSIELIDGLLKMQVEIARLHGFVLDGSDGGGLTVKIEMPAPRSLKPAPRQAARAKAIG